MLGKLTSIGNNTMSIMKIGANTHFTQSLEEAVKIQWFREGKDLHNLDASGHFVSKDLWKILNKHKYKIRITPGMEEEGRRLIEFDEGFLFIYEGKESVSISGTFLDETFRDTLEKQLDKILFDPPVGTFWVLVRQQSGYGLAEAGKSHHPLVSQNYTTDVSKQLDHIVACMKSNTPCGRLIIFDGAPGTGKSFAIRGLADKAPDCMFVLVAPSLVGSLSGPELIPVLLEQKEDGKPVVLIMEDADHALVTRARGSLTQLSELLNMGDGMLGDLVDLRVIATTNAESTQLDPAVVRPGRLCAHVEMEALTAKHANEVYNRLTDQDETAFTKVSTLAEVYRLAKQDGWKPPRRKEEFAGNYA